MHGLVRRWSSAVALAAIFPIAPWARGDDGFHEAAAAFGRARAGDRAPPRPAPGVYPGARLDAGEMAALARELGRFARFRTIDGTLNHPRDYGAAGGRLLRRGVPNYAALPGVPHDEPELNARLVSNLVLDQDGSILNARGASDWLWQWGQFVDHDLDLTVGSSPSEPFPILIAFLDPFFNPLGPPSVAVMPFSRSAFEVEDGARQHTNALTAFVDASQVYGSDDVRARALRRLDGSGKLLTGEGELLPFNTMGLPNAGGTSAALRVAGDIRVNEQLGLVAVHTLLVREHNALCDLIGRLDGERRELARREGRRAPAPLGDEELYQIARALVGAELQVITYRDFLGVLLGRRHGLGPYRGYDPSADPRVSNEFATAAFRVGHTLLSPSIRRLGADGASIAAGDVALRDAFFRGDLIATDGLEPVLRGLAGQAAQEIDAKVVDDVRNFLFGPPGAGGFDLASLNIQRGRDHGLPTLNGMRRAMGLAPHLGFESVTASDAVREALALAYGDVELVDLWVGGLAEDHVADAMVGSTFHAVLSDQFARLRAGDAFWHEREGVLPPAWRAWVARQSLGAIIRRASSVGAGELPPDVFVVAR